MTGWFENGPRLMRRVMSAGYFNHAFLEATMEGNIYLQGCRDKTFALAAEFCRALCHQRFSENIRVCNFQLPSPFLGRNMFGKCTCCNALQSQ
jgi:hypothetical protein